MPKLTQKDKYAIQYLHGQNKSAKEIAEELGFSVSQVKRFTKELTPIAAVEQTPDEDEKTEPAKNPKNKVKDLMIRTTSAKHNNTVSVMTQGAAQVGDEFYKALSPNKVNTDNYIYRRPE